MKDCSFEELPQYIAGLKGIDPASGAGLDMRSQVVHGHGEGDPVTGSISSPIYPSAAFTHPSFDGSTGYYYGRCGNPTRLVLEDTVAQLEGGQKSFAFTSGMAAITTLVKCFKPGDHFVVSDDLYGGTHRLFKDIYAHYGFEFSFVDLTDLEVAKAAVRPNTRAFFAETPTNPMMKVVDLRKLADIAHEAGAMLIVDNTLMTPLYQRPFELGADIVMHSGTKFLCGHNDVIAGFVVLKDERILESLFNLSMAEGANLSPFDCWLMLRSIKTLSVRMDRQQENAAQIARFLKGNPHVTDVYYVGDPEHEGYELHRSQAGGFGSMISFRVDSTDRVMTALERIKLVSYAESLGSVESLMTFPLVQTHSSMPKELRDRLGIDERLLRLSVGIEAAGDLITDLEQALA